MNIKKEDFELVVRRPYAVLFSEVLLHGQFFPEYFKGILNKRFRITKEIICEADIYYSVKEMNDMRKLVFDSWKSQKVFAKAKKIILTREKQLLKVASGNDFEKFCDAIEAYTPALMTVVSMGVRLEKTLRETLLKKVSKEETDAIMDKLNIPLEDNFYKKEEYDLVTAKDLKKHVKEYEWIKSRYGSYHPYTVEEAKEKLGKIDKKSFLKHWDEEKQKIKDVIKKAKKLAGEGHLIDVMQFIVYYRTQRTDVFNKAFYLFIPSLRKLAKKKGLTYEQLINCTKREILGKQPPVDVINERIRGFTQTIFNGKIETFSGEESRRIKEILKEDVSGIKELKGSIASRGFAKGTVKIVLHRDDFGKVKEGDILVASMTTPEMVSTMKKAAAFITNEGGITCHAAIISRELKKPCIIGTKIATKVLHDGDVVEVDANKGIVRKL